MLGDAVCSLNPLYAQGMSMALREAALLGRIVDRHGTRGVGVAFLREATPLVDAAWTLATSADLGHPEIAGPRTVTWRLLDRYVGRLLRVAHRDPVVANTYLRALSRSGDPVPSRHQTLARPLGTASWAPRMGGLQPQLQPQDLCALLAAAQPRVPAAAGWR